MSKGECKNIQAAPVALLGLCLVCACVVFRGHEAQGTRAGVCFTSRVAPRQALTQSRVVMVLVAL